MRLSERIDAHSIQDYHILRFRDDYRIFTNNPQDSEVIVKLLTEILIELGMRLNVNKTVLSNQVIKDSVKADKLTWSNNNISSTSFQKHLLNIHTFSEQYPNSGSLIKSLDKYLSRLYQIEEIKENVGVLISIAVDIAYRNPRSYSIICGILSKLFTFITEAEQITEIIEKIKKRFNAIPNTGHIDIWLQRITIKINRDIEYNEPICKKIRDNSIQIWNSEWLNAEMETLVNQAVIVNEEVINDMDEIIKPEEIQLFNFDSSS